MSTTPSARPPSLTPAAVNALLLDTTPWLSCEDCFERMDLYVDALLDDGEHRDRGMEAHLLGCSACAEEVRSLLGLLAGDGSSGPA
jgi:hypothetical protein